MVDDRQLASMPPVQLTLFADFGCPFSYVTEEALHRLPRRISLTVRAHLPEAPPAGPPNFDADAWERLAELAAALDLSLTVPMVAPDTRKAHEAARYAREMGSEREVRSALYRAYWSEGRDIGRIDVLTALGDEVGLDAEGLRIALDIDRYAPDVLGDVDVARRLRVPGTPTLFVGTGRSARVLIGARSAPEIERVIADWLAAETT